MNTHDRDLTGSDLASLHYGDGEFVVSKPGRYVICAVSKVKIPVEALRYWNPALQEAYATPVEALARWKEPQSLTCAFSRRAAVLGLASAALTSPARAAQPLDLAGRIEQGGYAIGRTTPGAGVFLDGQAVATASDAGVFIVGFDRDAGPRSVLRVTGPGGETVNTLEIARGDFDIQRINGLGSPYQGKASPELEARIAGETARKQAAFASRTSRDDFKAGFSSPLTSFRVSARFGGQRIVNGLARPPHYGIDMAAPTGTPVHAPAGGVVQLAETGMLYEGGLIMIDHGQGLVAAYLHLSGVDVLRGQVVTRGQRIGAVGASGCATGPHLCWRLKWRRHNMNPMLLVGGPRPV